jgi:hypothetical protein
MATHIITAMCVRPNDWMPEPTKGIFGAHTIGMFGIIMIFKVMTGLTPIVPPGAPRVERPRSSSGKP